MQSAFLKGVHSGTVIMQDMGNPFLEERNDVLVLDTKYIMASVPRTVINVKTIGQDQCSKFINEILSKKVCDACHRSIAQEQTITLQPPSSERTFEKKSTAAVNEE